MTNQTLSAKSIETPKPQRCPWCRGTGRVGGGDACGCDGGYLPGYTVTAHPIGAVYDEAEDAAEKFRAEHPDEAVVLAKVVAQLNAARLPGEKCEYVIDENAQDMVSLTVTFRGVVHAEPAWCEMGMAYTEDGLLEADRVARTHSNTKFSLTKKLTKKYAR